MLAFAKAYGCTKYFYPGDEAARLDWDQFGSYGAWRLEQSTDWQVTMDSLFGPVAPLLHFSNGSSYERDPVTVSGNSGLIVRWQHLGNGEGKVGPVYQSLRTNRPVLALPESTDDFGYLLRSMDGADISPFLGQEVTISLLVRPDLAFVGRTEFLFDVTTDERQRFSSGTTDLTPGQWHTLETTVSVPQDARALRIILYSAILHGALDFKDLRLTVRQSHHPIPLVRGDSLAGEWRSAGPNHLISVEPGTDSPLLHIARNPGSFQPDSTLYPLIDNLQIYALDIHPRLTLNMPLQVALANGRTQPEGDPAELIRQMENWEIADEGASGLTYHQRLGNIIKVWSTLHHFYPYFDLSNTDWDQQFLLAFAKNKQDISLFDHVRTLQELITPLNDSHMGVYLNQPLYFPPIEWMVVDDQLVITQVLDSTLSLQPGDAVQAVNGQDWQLHWNEALSRSPGATRLRKELRAREASLAGPQGTPLTITVDDRDLRLIRSLGEENYAEQTAPVRPEFDTLAPDQYYINLTNMSWADLEARLPQLTGATHLILDLRDYPGWRNDRILRHLTTDTLRRVSTLVPRVDAPDRSAITYPDAPASVIAPASPFLSAKVLVLTDAHAISYAETILNVFDHYGIGEIIGTRTAGTTGNVNTIFLSGGITIPWTGMRVLDQDGELFHGEGIRPGIQVTPTIEDIRLGRDVVLEAAMGRME